MSIDARQTFRKRNNYSAGSCRLIFKIYVVLKKSGLGERIKAALQMKEWPTFVSSGVADRFIEVLEGVVAPPLTLILFLYTLLAK